MGGRRLPGGQQRPCPPPSPLPLPRQPEGSPALVLAPLQAGGAAASLLAILAAGSDAAQLWAVRGLRCMAEAGAGHEGAAALLDAGAASALMKLLEEAPEAPSSSDALLEALLGLLGLLCQAGVEGQRAQVLGPGGLLRVAGAHSCWRTAPPPSYLSLPSTSTPPPPPKKKKTGAFGSAGEGPCAAAAKVRPVELPAASL